MSGCHQTRKGPIEVRVSEDGFVSQARVAGLGFMGLGKRTCEGGDLAVDARNIERLEVPGG